MSSLNSPFGKNSPSALSSVKQIGGKDRALYRIQESEVVAPIDAEPFDLLAYIS